jgi:prolyl-tRNA synthetase
MLLSQYFLPLIKEDPKEASIVSHKLMLRAGMMRQLTSGIYNWLPLGLKVLNKVSDIVRAEMNNVSGVEMLMPCIQPIDLWEKSGRYGTGDDLSTEMLQIKDRHGNLLTFSPTAEEVIADLFNNSIQSYKDLPKTLYQIQWKFRDEIRPRFGVMRAREFLMKDAYSFHMSQECALNTYRDMLIAYSKSYARMGLKAIPVKADTGSMGGDYSHEFHVLADTGESQVYYENGVLEYLEQGNVTLEGFAKFYAADESKHDPKNCPVASDKLNSRRGIEVGHIFYLGDKYSKALNVTVQDKNGQLKHPDMGCYGIGISRLVAAIIEANHDEKGIIWPEHVAPFKVGIINLRKGDEACDNMAQDLYDALRANSIEVLYDDTEDSAGNKFARMDLIGLPWVVTIGPRGAKENKAELKQRKSSEKHEITLEAIKQMLLAIPE